MPHDPYRHRLTPAQKRSIATSSLFLAFVSEHYGRDPYCQSCLAYALELGKPIRVLRQRGVKIPEDAFAGVQDYQVALSRGAQADAEQVERWIEELRGQETRP